MLPDSSKYQERGEADRAFEWLSRAYKDHDLWIEWTSDDPFLDNWHEDPRWLPFLKSIRMAQHQLDAIEFNVTLPE
jgi:hypothetical protein